MTVDFVTDRRGQEIRAGDQIAYATNDSYLRLATVISFTEAERDRHTYDRSTNTSIKYRETYVKIKIQAENSDKPSYLDSTRGHYVKLEKL
jgi:hypothetical protein